MRTAAETCANFARELQLSEVPGEVRETAKLHVLDVLGCGLAASGRGIGGEARDACEASTGRASVIASESCRPGPDAALANGTLCHALDFDDTHSGAIVHVSSVVVPAAMAAAEECDAGGDQLLTAIIAGNEVAIRIGTAASGGFHRRGFQATSVCGVFGATIAGGLIHELSGTELVNALGLAGSFAGGIFEYLNDGSATKPLHAGWAAHSGLMASALAKSGAEGPTTVLEGPFGLYATHAEGEWDIYRELGSLGRSWETAEVTYKPYPACHYIHAAIDATRIALNYQKATPESISYIEATVPKGAVAIVLEPLAAKKRPRTSYDAKFSLPFAVASATVHGEVNEETFENEKVTDSAVWEVASRVGYRIGDFASYPGAFPGAIDIGLVDGQRYTAEVLFERGHPRNPMSVDEIRNKFRMNSRIAIGDDASSSLENAVLSLDEHTDLHSTFAPLRKGGTS